MEVRDPADEHRVGVHEKRFGDRGLIAQHVAVGDGHALGVTGRAGGVLQEGDGVGGDGRGRPRVRVGERCFVDGHAQDRALEAESFDARAEQVAKLRRGQCQVAVGVAEYPGDPPHAPLIVRQRRGYRDDSGVEAAEERPPEVDARLEQQQHRAVGLRS